ncbi:MAG: hypothetical protein D6767_09110 [Candidatus Hydrogenedentota bacterium]|nr:MAG: hypothetical protein D6767_09110 [Candidatus Hydrogenedentota bacterium]
MKQSKLKFALFILYVLFLLLSWFKPEYSLWQYRGLGLDFYAFACFLFFMLLFIKGEFPMHFSFVAFAIILRLLAFTAHPFTSDIFRYISDGKLWLLGENPYVRSALPISGIEYMKVGTIYPPFSEFLFTVVSLFTESVYGFKLLAGIFESLLLWFAYRFYKVGLISKFQFFFFLFCPALIMETWREGHIEIVSVFFFLLAYKKLEEKQQNQSFVYLLLSGLTKLHGFALFPIWLKKFAQEKKTWFLGVIMIGILAWLYYFYVLPVRTHNEYFRYWTFAQPFYGLFRVFGISHVSSIKILQLCLLTTWIILGILWLKRKWDDTTIIRNGLFAFLAFFPVLHPWYLFIFLWNVLFDKKTERFAMGLITLWGVTYLYYR